MKKVLYSAIALVAVLSCSREQEAQVQLETLKTRTVTIQAGFEATKTAYDAQGKFSWVAGDKIAVITQKEADGDIVEEVVTFTTEESGPVVTFTGEVTEGFEVAHFATYPFTGVQEGYARNDFAYEPDKKGFRLWGSIKPSVEDPLSCTPLLGTKDADGIFQFSTATGIVKFTVKNVPMETAYAYLEVPSETKEQYNLNGWYSPTDDGTISMATAIEPWDNRYNWNVPTEANSIIDYYFFIPEGKIPAGSKFELCNSGWAAIKSFPIKQDITVTRNIITNVAPVECEETKVYTLDDVLGTYDMKVSSSWVSDNSEPGDLVIEESDDKEKGTVMITKFAGISGKQYGYLENGLQLVFPADQLFGENTFEDTESVTKAEFPYVALDAYWNGTGVVDAVFKIVERGVIEFVKGGDNNGANDAIGLRATTEELWLNDSHNGGWKWSLGFGSMRASWKGAGPVQVPLTADMITVSIDASKRDFTEQYDGSGKGALVDGNTGTFWHTPWKDAGEDYFSWADLDATYGAYIDIDLGEGNGLAAFQLAMCLRSANGNFPKHVIVYGSADGSTWGDAIADVANICAGISPGSWINNIECTAASAVRYIRISIIENTSGQDLRDPSAKACTHLAEIELYK